MPVQYIMYAPYGEQLLNQHAGTYDERFTFTGKERDMETGYDYFGARYYLPFASIFGSVDPLTDKNIELSSYMYCRGNPIKFVDPDGRTYAINTNGKTEHIDDGNDQHVILNANISRDRVEFDLTKGKILELYPTDDISNVNLLVMENLDVANELYDKMAENVSMLEFNVVAASNKGKEIFYVGNTQDSKHTGIGHFIFEILGQTIDYMKHFHPTNPKASPADKDRAKSVYRNTTDYSQANPNAELHVTYRNEEGELKDDEY